MPPYRHSLVHCTIPATRDIVTPHGRELRPDPRQPLLTSYLTQSFHLTWAGQTQLLEPSAPGGDAGPDTPAYLLSAWHPMGAPTPYSACRQRQAELRDRLNRAGYQQAIPATAIAFDRGWFEANYLVLDINEQDAVALAAQFGQAATLRWQGRAISLIPTGVMPGVSPATFGVRLRPAPPTCPIRNDELVGAQCVRIGDPHAGAAIHVQLNHRALALDTVGCRACDDGRTHHQMQRALGSLDRAIPASRHGGTYWPRVVPKHCVTSADAVRRDGQEVFDVRCVRCGPLERNIGREREARALAWRHLEESRASGTKEAPADG